MARLALLTGVLAVVSRVLMARAAAGSGKVDHYYWMLAAQAYRTQRGLPVRLEGKYLLEDEAQAYPPLFGFLLGRWHLDRWGIGAVWALELVQLGVLVILLGAFGAPLAAIALAVTVYSAAPVLVMYDTQLNSRILGEVLLFTLMAAEACAVFVAQAPAGQILLWSAAAALTALVIMTHKMTLQLQMALLLPWSFVLGTMWPLLAFLCGVALFFGIVGRPFAIYQLRTHWDIVRFWNRNWRRLGGHQFRDSPIYGTPYTGRSTYFHQPGLRGIAKHFRVVLSYAPFNLVLPFASLATGWWPPPWLLLWLAAIYIWALATLFVPPLKCFGGGHLYVFNAVAPGACYVAWLPDTAVATRILTVGVILTAVSLAAAWRIVRNRSATRDQMFQQVVSALAVQPKGRVAVFPLQSAEAVAWSTHHAVLWGGHGYGFSRLEGFFPVLTEPLTKFLDKYEIGWVLWDERYWVGGVEKLTTEGMRLKSEAAFGHWRLVGLTR
ncbi:MAG TPA: hypothetical protein VGJ39_12715 [Vicinamibacterales bacterium]|jgi:hypothetical protein